MLWRVNRIGDKMVRNNVDFIYHAEKSIQMAAPFSQTFVKQSVLHEQTFTLYRCVFMC